jgi:hypothetical protein
MTAPLRGWYPDPTGDRAQEHYWDGTNWSQQWRPAPLPEPLPEPLSIEERSERLDAAIIELVQHGARVEARSATQAVIVTGKRASTAVHILHFFLTLLTFGVWVFVWILYALSRRETRETLSVDSYGNVTSDGSRWRWPA